MRQLILLRHAKAEPSAEGLDDFDRALAQQGRVAAPKVAQALVDAGAAPDIALVSDAKRTRETWGLAQPAFRKTTVKFLPSLYLCAAETLMEAAETAGAESVMLVGHNPGLHELASRLAHRNTPLEMTLRAKFTPASAALFERKSTDASWKLAAFVTPKDLGL